MLSNLKKKIHIFHNIYLKHKHFIKKKTYSMDGEDIFIVEHFRKKNNGFYIDVGCYHPIHRNNTFLLYKNGWSGINIDIHQFSIDLFNYLRPDDVNLNCAVSNTNGVTEMFYQKALSQISTIDKQQAKIAFQGNIKSSKIESFTLDVILEKLKFNDKKIDLLDVDVEGADLQVLKGLNFSKRKPKLICVEIHQKNFKKHKIYRFLIKKKYKLIWHVSFSFLFKRK